MDEFNFSSTVNITYSIMAQWLQGGLQRVQKKMFVLRYFNLMLKFITCHTYVKLRKINWLQQTCTEFLFHFELMNHFIYFSPPPPFFAPACSIYRACTCTQFVFFFFALKYRRFYWIFSFFLFLIKQYFLRVPLIKHFINFITKVFSLTYLRDGKIICDVLNIAY